MDTIDRIESKLDKLDEKLDGHAIILAKQEENLSEHIRRTEIAEESIKLLSEEMKPIQTHVNNVRLVGKVVLWLLSSGIITYFLSKLFN